MRAVRFSRAVATALVLAIAASLSGCSLIPDPPADVTASVDAAVAKLRGSAGVAEVTADIGPYDFKDGGPLSEVDAWRATITVQADTFGVDAPDLAESVVSATDFSLGITTAVLRIPGGNGDADAELTFRAHAAGVPVVNGPVAMAEAALTLRALADVESVTVSDNGDPARVVVDSATDWIGLTTTLRALDTFGADGLAAVTLSTPSEDGASGESSLTIDGVSPTTQFVDGAGRLAASPGVQSLLYRGIDPRHDSSTQRPALWVRVAMRTQVDSIAGQLAGLPDSHTVVEGVPRASFEVSAVNGDAYERRDGYLGLPVGSPEPDDHVRTPDLAAPLDPVDPAADAAMVEGDRSVVTALLDAAGDTAGIRGVATVTADTCETGVGQQVYGNVVIPIFEIADSADEAFAAITASWEKEGFVRSDRAMGRDFYSASDGSLDTLSIRGTGEGISILATTPCTTSR